MIKTKNNRKNAKRPTLSVGNFVLLKRVRLYISESLYFIHLPIRKLHDNTYKSSKTYKKYSDAPISHAVHKATLTAFVVSFMVFYSLQYLVPLMMNPFKPGVAQAAVNAVYWKTYGDFTGKVDTNGALSGSQPTDDANVTLKPGALGWSTETSLANAPDGRYGHVAVWTGETGNTNTANRMIIWGGEVCCDELENTYTPSVKGSMYNPATDTWSAISATNGPDMMWIKAVWTGNTGNANTANRMIIWGGSSNIPKIYNPATNIWTNGSATNAPTSRMLHKAIWTGNTGNVNTEYRMIVWGGKNDASGGIYNPATDTWAATSTSGAPLGYFGHSMVWTGSKMIVWGGATVNGAYGSSGSIYDPVANNWTLINFQISGQSEGSPTARFDHSAVWTGSKMVVWGGNVEYGANNGGIWRPQGDNCTFAGGCWKTMSTTNMPFSRKSPVIWTGSKMIIWDGNTSVSGGIWVAQGTDSCIDERGCWQAMPTTNAPEARSEQTAIWTGSEMIVWGGSTLNTGKRFSSVYAPSSVISGLTTSQTVRVQYVKGTYALTQSLPANTSVIMAVRAADTSGALSSAVFYDLSGVVQLSSADAACIALSASAGKVCYQGNVVGAAGGVLAGKYAEVKATLATSNGAGTPTLDGIALSYDTLEDPQNVAVKRFTSNGTDIIAVGGYTNETTVKVTSDALTCTGCTGTVTGRKIQVQFRKTEDGVFTSDEAINLVNGTSVDNGNGTYASIATLAGLEVGKSYQLRYRATDDIGRVTSWVYYGSGVNSAAEADFTIDQTAPTLTSISANSGAANTNNKLINIALTGAADANSGVGQMRFSNNGTDWSNWETYNATKTGWDLTTYPTNTSDGARTIYAQVRDSAGNVCGKVDTATADFSGQLGNQVIKTNNELKLSDAEEVVANETRTGNDPPVFSTLYSRPGATATKVYWSWQLEGDGNVMLNSGATTYRNYQGVADGAETTEWFPVSQIQAMAGGYDGQGTFTIHSVFFQMALPASSDYTSPVLGDGSDMAYNSVNWNESKPAGTNVTMQFRSGNTATVDGTWSGWTDITNGGQVPDNLNDNNYFQYKVTLLSNPGRTQSPSIYDVSVGTAKSSSSPIILDTTAPTVPSNTITSPNGSETWKGGSSQTITWNSAGITDAGSGLRTSTPPIKLEYTADGTNWNLIAENEANDGTYTWTVPATLNTSPLNSTTVKVRLTATDVVGNSANDVSNANFIVDSSAPTGAIGSLGQYYKTTAIDVPYTAGDTANAMIETGRTGLISCHDNTQSATIENLSASLVRVNFSATSDGNSFGNGGTFTVTVFNGLTQVASFNNYSGLSGNYGLAAGNKVVYTCDDFEVNEGIYVNVSADFSGQQTISGVKQTKLYYTRQTTQPYTWTAYPNNSTPTNFNSSPISFDTTQIADVSKTGNYGFKIVVEDNAGNVSTTPISTTTPDSATFIDVNVPTGTLTINSGAVATNDINNASLAFTLSDVGSGLASYQIDNNDGNWLPATPVDISSQSSPYSGTFSGWHLIAGDGLKTVRIRLLDKAGNEVTNITDTIAVDSTPPTSIDAIVAKNGDNFSETLSASGISNGWYPYSNFNFYIKAVDEQSGIKEFKYCFVKAAETCDYSANPAITASKVGSTTSYEANKTITLTDDRQGTLTLKVKGVDFVGLESSEATYVYKFDKILPGAIMNFNASKGTELTTVKLVWDDPHTSATAAPSQKFKIERILAEAYTPGLGYDGVWSGVASYNQQTLDVVIDAAVLVKVGNTFTYYDQTMQNSLKYLYRVSAKDYSNPDFGGFPVDDPEFVNSGYGYTRDVAAPEVYPSGVVAIACNSNVSGGVCDGVNKKGHQVQVKWLPAEDSGAGVAGYEIYRREGGSAEPSGWTKIEVNFAETADALNVYRVYYDNIVVDAKSYSYRIVAFDNIPAELGSPNKTELFRGNDYTNLDNATATPANVPDVTPPTVPASFSATPMGIDYILDESGEYHQKISSAWKQTTDNNLLTNITYQLYFSATNVPENFVVVDTQNSAPFNSQSQQESERISYKYDQTGLADKTTFYYYLKVTDALGNSATSSIKSATTGNSQAPTPPTGVEVHNDTVGIDSGTQLTVKFRGSLAKNCDEGTKADCIATYETYRAETNITADIDGSLTSSDSSDNCNLGETPDDCWIRINNATLANTQTPNPPVANETLAAKRTFLATGLAQATKYYFRVRALDNNTDEPLSSPLSTVYEDQIHTGGWDITRDLTSPALPGTGLEVKVKDTHPNTSVLRNIISWKILEETPLRKKQSYEKSVVNGGSCTIVNSGGKDYCKDFGRYEIYRQILDVNNNIIYESETPIATITDPETNLYIDSIGNNDVLEGVTGTPKIIDTKIRYYVQVVDNSYDAFLYENGSKINTAPNKSVKQYSTDTIIPSKATPSVVGSVNLSDVAVTSAIVSWNTDQDTDSLVQYRISGSSSDWVTVGQVERRPNHSVKLFGLVPNTAYEYKLVSRNYLDNRATYNESSLPILKTGGFNIVEGSVSTVTTTTGVEVKWSTNLDASSSFVEYQMQTQPGDEPQGKTVGVNPSDIIASPRNHKVTFNGLKSNRTYYFKIKSLSKDGFVAEYPVYDEVNKKNLDTFATQSFDTSQFTITPSSSNVAEKNITSTTALIAWSTGVPTTSWVDFSPNHITKENKTISSAGNNDLNTQHAVQIEGLIPGTKYFYVVRSKNANDIEFTSPEYSFTAILKPKILDFKIMEVKPYQISVAWTTNVDTETIVNWGKTTAYGEKRGKNEQTQNHLLTIDQLEDNTEYHLQIVAHDETGTEVVDADKIIKTPLDTQGPKIESVKTDILPMGASDETGSVIISWNTDKPATTKIEYDEGIIAGRYNMSSIEDTTLNLSHTVIIKNLKPAASYHYRIAIKDKRNNQTISQDYTFVTPSKEKSILQLILKSLEETFSWTKNMNKFFGNVGKRVTGK